MCSANSFISSDIDADSSFRSSNNWSIASETVEQKSGTGVTGMWHWWAIDSRHSLHEIRQFERWETEGIYNLANSSEASENENVEKW